MLVCTIQIHVKSYKSIFIFSSIPVSMALLVSYNAVRGGERGMGERKCFLKLSVLKVIFQWQHVLGITYYICERTWIIYLYQLNSFKEWPHPPLKERFQMLLLGLSPGSCVTVSKCSLATKLSSALFSELDVKTVANAGVWTVCHKITLLQVPVYWQGNKI